MKRFLIPAFFVIDVADNEGIFEAEAKAAEMQAAANAANAVSRCDCSYCREFQQFLMVDEEKPTREIPVLPGETELPGTY